MGDQDSNGCFDNTLPSKNEHLDEDLSVISCSGSLWFHAAKHNRFLALSSGGLEGRLEAVDPQLCSRMEATSPLFSHFHVSSVYLLLRTSKYMSKIARIQILKACNQLEYHVSQDCQTVEEKKAV